MSEEPKPRRVAENIPSIEEEVSALGSANAPIIYFESAAAFGHVHGAIMRITLTTSRMMPRGGQAVGDHVVVAHLRMSPVAAQSLRDALDKALLGARRLPTTGKPN